MNDATERDLARIGAQLGEKDTELFKKTLYNLSSSQSNEIGTERNIEFVSAQVYDEANEKDTEKAEEYVRTFLAVFDISDLGDVDDLLGRQTHVEDNYSGHKAFV